MGPDGEMPSRMSRVYVGEVPNNHNQPLGPIPQMPNPMVQAVDTGVNVLANGANALYRGAASVGQAFGFNAQAYEGPLFSAASQLLGKKRRHSKEMLSVTLRKSRSAAERNAEHANQKEYRKFVSYRDPSALRVASLLGRFFGGEAGESLLQAEDGK
ncbi:unnamed protein product [Haemonchus placei]|uniref:Minor capsid protein n=1 Tax=Haemonchus placei TaxID=6290 RepID=A0A0N4WZZ4_HAEPC|nr:unnamed protein product [Haemonchus placei]